MGNKIIIIISGLIFLAVLGAAVYFRFSDTNELIKDDLIKVKNFKINREIKSPLIIEGEARGNWYFEASFPIKILDADGNVLGTAIAQAQSDWMVTDFVPFKAQIEFSLSTTKEGELVLIKDNPSGLPEYDSQFKIPVIFKEVAQIETMIVKAFFNNNNLDPEISCNKVFPVERTVQKTEAVAGAALEELLKGPTEEEKTAGFSTNINPDVKIQSLTVENGTARVDFDSQLEFQVGGSCKVSAIRAEITQTLKQFPTVENVVISINGRTEDILQP